MLNFQKVNISGLKIFHQKMVDRIDRCIEMHTAQAARPKILIDRREDSALAEF